MEADPEHSVIEKRKRKIDFKIEHPHDLAQLIPLVGQKKPFVVHEMEQSQFFYVAELYSKSLVNRKQNRIGSKFNWREVRWIRYVKEGHWDFYKNLKTVSDQTDVFPDASSDKEYLL
ncbi:unnamed protein product [Acanthoscelides obtectus]|uniref:Uncharacterized protein n=1 Tax=Acanthoscelides obtectus TaxID=200917 RepID=A0A9P0LC24_ACAOB|nr:unnamed protein product [Acanthoscelides obtectus]CAK1624563.1 hypothetical protein AOBTE_LOCUS2614 [Acanthoscelides obtectus]